MPLRAWPAAAVLALTLLSPRARATECRAIEGGTDALARIDAQTRLHWLDRRLAIDAHNERLWSGLWGSLYGGIVVVQSALAATQNDTGSRAENIVGASASMIGVLAVVIMPPSLERDQSWWEKHKRRAPDSDVCASLATAERLLARGAASEAFGISPLVHIGNFAINIAAGLILGLGWDRWAAFAYVGLVGIAVGEVQVITQPTAAIEDLRLYKNGQLGEAGHTARLQWGLRPWAGRDGAGATFALRF